MVDGLASLLACLSTFLERLSRESIWGFGTSILRTSHIHRLYYHRNCLKSLPKRTKFAKQCGAPENFSNPSWTRLSVKSFERLLNQPKYLPFYNLRRRQLCLPVQLWQLSYDMSSQRISPLQKCPITSTQSFHVCRRASSPFNIRKGKLGYRALRLTTKRPYNFTPGTLDRSLY